MRKLFIALILAITSIFCAVSAMGQAHKGLLRIRLVSHEGANGQDYQLNELLRRIISETSLSEKYSDVDIRASGYDDDISHLSEDAIVSFSPTKFIETRDALGDEIIPVFVVEKEKNAGGLYNAQLITSLSSNIKDIEKDFHKIKTFYFVDKKSTSGYIYALRTLRQRKLIKEVCDCELENEGIEVIFTGEHKFVQEKVSKNDFAVGAVWNADESKVKVSTSSSEELPQDVIFISHNLKPYLDEIRDWLRNKLELYPGYFENSSQHIVGFIDYNNVDWDWRYNELLAASEEVEKAEEKLCGNKFNLYWLIKNKTDLWNAFVSTLIVSAFMAIFTYIINQAVKYFKARMRAYKRKRKNRISSLSKK